MSECCPDRGRPAPAASGQRCACICHPISELRRLTDEAGGWPVPYERTETETGRSARLHGYRRSEHVMLPGDIPSEPKRPPMFHVDPTPAPPVTESETPDVRAAEPSSGDNPPGE